MIIFNIVVFIVGIVFTIFGLRILFEKGYVNKRYDSLNDQLMSPKDAYFANKYLTGIHSIVLGLIDVGYAIFALFFT